MSRSQVRPRCLTTFAALVFVACGGRETLTVHDGGGGSDDTGTTAGSSTATGSTSSTSATSSGTGTTSSSGSGGTGTTSGGMGSGGSTGAAGSGPSGSGGSASCRDIGCPAIGCGDGFESVLPPGACCPVCQKKECTLSCPRITCPPGFRLEVRPGACCPSCAPDSMTCDRGRKQYDTLRSQLLQKLGTIGCAVDSDCAVADENNRCTATCGVPLAASVVSNWYTILKASAETSCATCPPVASPPCLFITPRCSFGKCVQ
ncbi:MAG TPA: hypothetical protein VJT73_04795 [Polyangiaceae bacterium]|nr:hypothetical protein [Polyangiaceae bacterium]